MKRLIGLLLRDFSVILSCNVICATLFITILKVKSVDPALLWQMILLAALSVLTDFVYYVNGPIGKIPLVFKTVIQFVVVFALYMFGGAYFKWYNPGDTKFVLYFSVCILIGYILVFAIIFLNERKQAVLINKKLVEYKRKRGDDIE